MDSKDDTTVQAERKRGQHLGPEERGAIKALKKQGLGVRAISRAIGFAPSTVTNESARGTPPRRSSKGKAPGYSPRRGDTWLPDPSSKLRLNSSFSGFPISLPEQAAQTSASRRERPGMTFWRNSFFMCTHSI